MNNLNEKADSAKENLDGSAPKEEGDRCRFPDCAGTYGFEPVINCSCHISPPCHRCVDNPLVCLECGDDLPDAVSLTAQPSANEVKPSNSSSRGEG